MEEKPFFAPSGSGKKPEDQSESKKPKISFSPKGKGKKRKSFENSSKGVSLGALRGLSLKKILISLLAVLLLFFLLQNTLCSGGEDSGPTKQAKPSGSQEDQANTGSSPNQSGGAPLPGNSEAEEYSGDAVILINDSLEITSAEVDEREGLIASYLETNDITNLSDKEKKEAAISQLLQVSWAKEAAREAGIRISAKEVSRASSGKSAALTENLQNAGYSAAQIEDLIRLEIIRRALEKKALKKAKRVKPSRVRQAYQKAQIKKPFRKTKKKLKRKIRKKQLRKAKKGFQSSYERTWASRTACSPEYTVPAYCGNEL